MLDKQRVINNQSDFESSISEIPDTYPVNYILHYRSNSSLSVETIVPTVIYLYLLLEYRIVRVTQVPTPEILNITKLFTS